ncbi:helix-turn-helix transcriptional regulator [Methanococcoides methylutens]|uniref:Transcriptional regulator, ArsR family n=1 Tax=Methanococcoides methylutens MM1 TaxID=1434104 RepID=A0A0E3SPS6_METMT|nr:metalloregulator ArsR/SmtB family transcription factor [Methanococcoides methylutens]AKB84601.1 Transcriptional regulator, ArsR family [Methanococcoides methylutens MM1]
MIIPEPIENEVNLLGGAEGIALRIADDESIARQSSIHHALSSSIRLKILNLVLVQPLCVCLIKEITGMPDSKLSYHLSILVDNGLIRREKSGNWIIYHPTEEGRKYQVEI